jgi:hypothetical protein
VVELFDAAQHLQEKYGPLVNDSVKARRPGPTPFGSGEKRPDAEYGAPERATGGYVGRNRSRVNSSIAR